jgi:hypothetical protein
MKKEETTKLQAYADGQTMPKRQSPKRKKLKPKESAQKKVSAKKKKKLEQPKVIEVSSFDPIEKIEEQHNIIFKPNKGPQTEFLAAGEREVL